jgi:ribosomal protein S18 acetylase RimI-like enzyme
MGALGDYDELRSAEIAESLAALTLDHATFGLPGAVGLAVADGALCGLFDIAVARDRRRAGLGSRITSAAMRWGAARRCSIAYLQVTDGNRAARGLYDKLGFEERYRYWYRTRK